jgi:hypothetical protein
VISYFAGLRLVADPNMVDMVGEDWSRVRSPARAARRRKRGFPQRIRPVYAPKKEAYQAGDMIVAHPAVIRELMERLRCA